MGRRISLILLFLFAGAIVNVAVAWGLALVPPVSVTRFTGDGLDLRSGNGRYDYGQVKGVGSDRVKLLGLVNLFGAPPLTINDNTLRAAGFPSWMRVGPKREWSALQDASALGWPQRALWMANVGTDFGAPRAVHVLWLGRDHQLPTGVVLLGFSVNTLFHAALLWLLICGLLALRRLIRCRRGLCPKCAYPTGGSGSCTECGATLRIPPECSPPSVAP